MHKKDKYFKCFGIVITLSVKNLSQSGIKI